METYVVTATLNPAIDKTVVLEKLCIGEVNRIQSSRIDIGGKGINVAKVLKKFGVPVIASGLIAEVKGQKILDFLSEHNITSQFFSLPGENRTNLKIIDREKNEITEVNEAGFTVREEDIEEYIDKLSLILEKASYFIISGSLPSGMNANIYARLIRLAKRKGVKTILDTDGCALEEGIKAFPYAIKPNVRELEKLMGKKLESEQKIIDAAMELLDQGIEIVVVSMGHEGAMLLNNKEAYRAKPILIQSKSAVGAGDAMVAALVSSFLRNDTLEKTAQWMTAAGAITACKEGSQVCNLEETERLLKDVKVLKLY